MADLLPATTILQQTTTHAAALKPHIQYIKIGVPYMTAFLDAAMAGIAGLAAGFGLGWYVKARGLKGVQTDLKNAETTVKTATSPL